MLVVLRDDSGGYWFEVGDFQRLRLVLPALPPHEQGGHSYYPLNAIVGAEVSLDSTQGLLQVQLPPAAFAAQALSASTSGEDLHIESGTGLFANYDLYALNSRGDVGGSAYGEIGPVQWLWRVDQFFGHAPCSAIHGPCAPGYDIHEGFSGQPPDTDHGRYPY